MATKRWEKLWKEMVHSQGVSMHHQGGNFNQSELEKYREAQVMGKVLPLSHLDHKLSPGSGVQVAVGMEEISWGNHTAWASKKETDTHPEGTQCLIF